MREARKLARRLRYACINLENLLLHDLQKEKNRSSEMRRFTLWCRGIDACSRLKFSEKANFKQFINVKYAKE